MCAGVRFSFRLSLIFAFVVLAANVRAEPIYFGVAELPGHADHHDSFVLPLSDPADISHARALINNGPGQAGASIVFADIIAGSDNINRDLLSPTHDLWSWHVSKFDGFGDFGIELLDGWPSFVEQDVSGWIKNTNGKIGFWSYTIVSELRDFPGPTPQPIPVRGVVPAAFLIFLFLAACIGYRTRVIT